MNQPDIFLGDLRIQEPITTLTDILIGSLCVVLATKLHKTPRKTATQSHLALYFYFLSAALSLGGILGHGFLYILGTPGKFPGWVTSMIAMMFIERSAIAHARKFLPPTLHIWLMRINILELIILVFYAMYLQSFLIVEIHAIYGLLIIVTPLHLIMWIKYKDKGSRTILLSLVVLGLSMAVFNFRVAVSPWFNHNDLAHTIMAISAYILYLGGKKLSTT